MHTKYDSGDSKTIDMGSKWWIIDAWLWFHTSVFFFLNATYSEKYESNVKLDHFPFPQAGVKEIKLKPSPSRWEMDRGIAWREVHVSTLYKYTGKLYRRNRIIPPEPGRSLFSLDALTHLRKKWTKSSCNTCLWNSAKKRETLWLLFFGGATPCHLL